MEFFCCAWPRQDRLVGPAFHVDVDAGECGRANRVCHGCLIKLAPSLWHTDLARTSLVSRVWRGDGALIVSTIQAELDRHETSSCADVPPSDPGWQQFWMDYVPVISMFYGQDLRQADNVLVTVNRTDHSRNAAGRLPPACHKRHRFHHFRQMVPWNARLVPPFGIPVPSDLRLRSDPRPAIFLSTKLWYVGGQNSRSLVGKLTCVTMADARVRL
mmetsp:Transcript_29586/g.68560  ORF Transcript_29586/g.68560 Transcript_29586/m.68560 type:complete len:215 (+) Transcript_29586:48-692(+)